MKTGRGKKDGDWKNQNKYPVLYNEIRLQFHL